MEMQPTPILWNLHTAIQTITFVANAIVLVLLVNRIRAHDRNSKINQLFSVALVFLMLMFLLFPLGGLFWYVSILDIQFVLITTRLMQLSSFLSMLTLAWFARVLYLGENTWARRENLVMVVLATLIFLWAIMTPDAVYVIAGPPETSIIDTGEGGVYRWVYYLGSLGFIAVALIHFGMTYREYHTEDQLLGKQALRLMVGLGFGVMSYIVALVSTLLTTYSLAPLMFSSMTMGVLFMSSSFSEEVSLNRFKIASGLSRLRVHLRNGRVSIATMQLESLKNLVSADTEPAFYVRVRVLESKLDMYKGSLDHAKTLLDEALRTAKLQHTNEYREIETELDHLGVLMAAKRIGQELKSTEDMPQVPSLEDAISYLDDIILIHGTEASE